MTLSPRLRMIIGFVLANTAIIAVASLVLFNQPQSPPAIQGVLLLEARDLPPFRLLDHHNQDFSNRDLLGAWHLISYGFTTCPDVCPTTLAQLAQVKALLNIPDEWAVATLAPMGKPVRQLTRLKRREVEEMVVRGTWDGAPLSRD